jgi:hypothetical protein
MLDMVVKMDEVTATATLSYSFQRLERIEEYFGEGWFGKVLGGMEPPSPAIIRKMLEFGLDGADADQVLKHLPVNQIARRIGDALFLRLQGKTLDQIEQEKLQGVANELRIRQH